MRDKSALAFSHAQEDTIAMTILQFSSFSKASIEATAAAPSTAAEISAADRLKMPPVPPEFAADPAFALIAEKLASYAAHCRAIDLVAEFQERGDFSSHAAIAAGGEETAAVDYATEVEWKLARTQPSTLAGVAAVLRFVNEIEDANLTWPDTGDGWHKELRATMAAAIEALIRTPRVEHAPERGESVMDDNIVTFPGAPGEAADPIFAAIEGHRRAYAAMKTAPAGLDDDEYAQPEIDTAEVLQRTVPTTLEGLFALLTYLPVAIEQQDADTFRGLGLLFGDSADIFDVLARSVILLIDGGRHVR